MKPSTTYIFVAINVRRYTYLTERGNSLLRGLDYAYFVKEKKTKKLIKLVTELFDGTKYKDVKFGNVKLGRTQLSHHIFKPIYAAFV